MRKIYRKHRNWLRKRSLIKHLTVRSRGRRGHSFGKIVLRRRAAGFYNKIHYLDNKKLIWNVAGVIIAFERNKSIKSYIALICYPNGIFVYSVACAGLGIGDRVIAGWNVPPVVGNCLPLRNIPLNIKISLIESFPGSGLFIVRSPGNWAVILLKTNKYASIVFRTGKSRRFNLDCLATIGRVSNIRWRKHKLRKAGQRRNLGRRPWVRGVAQNPVDHPHGGGKGKKSKNAVPEGPWGRLGARKKRTRK